VQYLLAIDAVVDYRGGDVVNVKCAIPLPDSRGPISPPPNQRSGITVLSHPPHQPDIFSLLRSCFCFLTNPDIVNIERLDVLMCWSDGPFVCWRYVSGLGYGGIGEGRLY
jgi:hypothetical protein